MTREEDFHSDRLFGRVPKVAKSVVDEHLVSKTSTGYRFSLDSVAEFLLGEQIDSPDALDFRSHAGTMWMYALSFAPLRFEREGKVASVRNGLRALASIDGPQRRRGLWQIVRTAGMAC